MIKEQLEEVRKNIEAACKRAGRDPKEVTLIAVSKTKPVPMLEEAYEAGARDFGENKVQEIVQKKPELPEALNEDVKQVAKDFRKLTSDASPMLRNYLKQARLSAGEGNRLLIVLPDAVGAGVVGTEEHKEEIRNLIESKIGKKLDIDVRQVEEGRRFEDSFVDIEKLINMDIVVEDD